MKKIILVMSLLIMGLLVVSCAPAGQEPTEEEKAQLQELSDAELLEVATAENQAAVAGQAGKSTRDRSDSEFKGYKTEALKVLKGRMQMPTKFQFNEIDKGLVKVSCNEESFFVDMDTNGGEPIDPRASSCCCWDDGDVPPDGCEAPGCCP